MIDVEGIEIQPLYRRNYFFNYNYRLNFNLTKNLTLNYMASNNNVVRNYYDDEMFVDNSLGIWNGYFDMGTPNLRMQSLQLNYKLPFDKIPFLDRKSTRLNSSHVRISYAVFCLKKKN